MTIIVSVGRNIAGTNTPLGDDDWAWFQQYLVDEIADHGPVFFQGVGTGKDSTTIDHEESFTVIAEGPRTRAGRDDLHQALALLGLAFKQAAVAVTYGETRFVETGL